MNTPYTENYRAGLEFDREERLASISNQVRLVAAVISKNGLYGTENGPGDILIAVDTLNMAIEIQVDNDGYRFLNQFWYDNKGDFWMQIRTSERIPLKAMHEMLLRFERFCKIKNIEPRIEVPSHVD